MADSLELVRLDARLDQLVAELADFYRVPQIEIRRRIVASLERDPLTTFEIREATHGPQPGSDYGATR